MDEKIAKAKQELDQQKQRKDYDRATLKTDKVKFGHAFKMFWRQARQMNVPTSRHNYWYMLVWQWIIKAGLFVIGSILGSLGVISSLNVQSGGRTGMILLGLMFLFYIILGGYVLITYIPSLTMNMRRYKDLGLSRYWGMLVYIVLAILTIVYFTAQGHGSSIAEVIFIVIALGNLIICSLPKDQFLKKSE